MKYLTLNIHALSLKKLVVYLPQILIIFLIFITFLSTIHNPMFFDDTLFVEFNRSIRNIFNFDLLAHGGTQETRPLYNLSLALNYFFTGYMIEPLRLTNIVLHTLTCLAVYSFLNILSGDRNKGFVLLLVLLYSIHPLNNESINLISARSGILATLFMTLSLTYFYKYRVSADSKNPYLLISLMAGIFAQLSKEFAIILPFIIFFLDDLISSQIVTVKKYKSYFNKLSISYFLLFTIVPVLLLFFKNPHKGVIGFNVMPVIDFSLIELKIHLKYIFLIFLPVDLNLWVSPYIQPYPAWVNIIIALAISSIVFFSYSYRRKLPFLFLGLMIYILNLLPTSSVIPRKDLYGERLLYLSLIGVAIALLDLRSLKLNFLAHQKTRSAVFIIITLVSLISFFNLNFERNILWGDQFKMWEKTYQSSSDNEHVLSNLASAYLKAGNDAKFLDLNKRATLVNPSFDVAYYNLGGYYYGKKDFKKANLNFNMAVQSSLEKSALLSKIGSLYLSAGDIENARLIFNKAIKLDPSNGNAFGELGVILFNQKEYIASQQLFEKAKSLDRFDKIAFFNSGNAFYLMGKYEQASLDYASCIDLDILSEDCFFGNALSLIQLQRISNAQKNLRAILRFNPASSKANELLKKISNEY